MRKPHSWSRVRGGRLECCDASDRSSLDVDRDQRSRSRNQRNPVLAFLLFVIGGLAYSLHVADEIGREEQRIEEPTPYFEQDEAAQMLAAMNTFRRRSGRPERTIEDVELEVEEARRSTG